MYCVRARIGLRSAAIALCSIGFLGIGVWLSAGAIAEGALDDTTEWLGLMALLLCALGGAGGLLGTVGPIVSSRPLLVLTDEGVIIPRPWPRSRRSDRTALWADIAGIRTLTHVVRTRAATTRLHFLTFSPTAEAAERGTASRWERRFGYRGIPASSGEIHLMVPLLLIPDRTVAEIVAHAQARCPGLGFHEGRDRGPGSGASTGARVMAAVLAVLGGLVVFAGIIVVVVSNVLLPGAELSLPTLVVGVSLIAIGVVLGIPLRSRVLARSRTPGRERVR